MSRFRRTKIVATLGPATESQDILTKLIETGVNVVRLNFSHGQTQDHIDKATLIRNIAKELDTHVAILGDLQGPKIRVAKFKENKVHLPVGAKFVLDAELDNDAGTEHSVGIDYKALPQDLIPTDTLLLDDGRIQLVVNHIEGHKIHTTVTVGGILSNNKGINKKGGGLSAEALTEKDKRDIITAAQIKVDYLAVSFPRTGSDIQYARRLAQEAGFTPKLVAKVERAEAVATPEAMDDIIIASDGIMVARGDLGVEIGDPELVAAQKQLISRARKQNKFVITATQMMESMISSPMPTRAEVMDVANAVIDGTDAVMLSGETAAGQYPIEAVRSMAEVCLGAEKMPLTSQSSYRIDHEFKNINESISMATIYAANHLKGVTAMITLTESGSTALMMSRLSSALPIYGLSTHNEALNAMTMYRGVFPLKFNERGDGGSAIARAATQVLKEKGLLTTGDTVIITQGDVMNSAGTTNCMRIVDVE
ncbi:pyruvate kinase [Vibrio sp.]|nr:pyruvate kinase [Vibrio sp.]